MKSIKK